MPGITLLALGIALSPGGAQTRTRLLIATGATSGVYYPLGGGIAALISKWLPGIEATAGVTAGSVDNMKLLHTGRVALALTLPDTAWDAYQGQIKELKERMAVRTLLALHSNHMHIVVLEGSGIRSVADLRGKHVSTGAPGSGTEVKGLRVLEAYGLTGKDLRSQERLGVSESAAALKEHKIDAFIWDGGLPTAAIVDLAAAPGIKIHLIAHDDAVPKMVAKYGPLYFTGVIPKGTYAGLERDLSVAAATNLLVAHESMEEPLAYEITRLVLEHIPELMAVHKVVSEITLKSAVLGSPVPFHPGALRYYKEKGINVPSPGQ